MERISRFLIAGAAAAIAFQAPAMAAEVEVKGKVEDVATLGGRPLGLHLREQRVRYR